VEISNVETSNSGACFYVPGALSKGGKFFGKDVANVSLYRALVKSPSFREISFLLPRRLSPSEVASSIGAHEASASKIITGGLLNQDLPRRAGVLVRGQADLSRLAWRRRKHQAERAYSLVGWVHCIAPPAIRQYIADAAISPVQPWDALVCTSPAVQQNLSQMFAAWSEYLNSRYGSNDRRICAPMLPIIPLGVDCDVVEAAADNIASRAHMRSRLGVPDSDILVLWLGRLSFFEKAFPQPMFLALEEAATRTNAKLHFAMAGWFPNGQDDMRQYVEAAKTLAPSVNVHFLNGTDQRVVSELWAASDCFLSLVDNIQETFGLAPVEAMSAGLPVVASNWDGYRANVVNGEQGFLIETLGGPPGMGEYMLDRHLAEMDTYQKYVGNVAQHTAVHVGQAADAIAALAGNFDLRRKMGQSGRTRARSNFDWPVIAKSIRRLFDDLAVLRERREPFERSQARATHPVNPEPFGAFRGFASEILDESISLVLAVANPIKTIAMLETVALNRFGAEWRISSAEYSGIFDLFLYNHGVEIESVLGNFPPNKRSAVQATVMWMCKIGVLHWRPRPH
jgi:D-inositol-3-phosphate glycosyltransferase